MNQPWLTAEAKLIIADEAFTDYRPVRGTHMNWLQPVIV